MTPDQAALERLAKITPLLKYSLLSRWVVCTTDNTPFRSCTISHRLTNSVIIPQPAALNANNPAKLKAITFSSSDNAKRSEFQ